MTRGTWMEAGSSGTGIDGGAEGSPLPAADRAPAGCDAGEARAAEWELPGILADVAEYGTESLTLLNENREVVHRNAAARQLMHDLGQPLTPDALDRVYPPWAAERVEEAIARARESGPSRVETALLDAAGREHPIAQTVMCHRCGRREYVSILSRDVSELRFTHSLLHAERDVLEMIASGQATLEQILRSLCRHMDALSGDGRHSVLRMDEGGGRLLDPIGPALSEAHLEGIATVPVSPRAGACGSAAYLGRQVVVEDVNGDPRWSRGTDQQLIAEGFRACTSTPIADGEGAILGTFAMYFPGTRGPTEREQAFIRTAVSLAAIAIQQRRRQAEQEFLATHDSLTRLPNRVLFRDRVDSALNRAAREKEYAAVLFLDLDDFKQVNDEQGHEVGDALICEIAGRLRESIRAIDTVARIGGDEFVVLLARLARPEDAARVATKLMERFAAPAETGFGRFHLRVSMGIATYPVHGDDTDALLRRADLAMYTAKGQPGSSYAWAVPERESHGRPAIRG